MLLHILVFLTIWKQSSNYFRLFSLLFSRFNVHFYYYLILLFFFTIVIISGPHGRTDILIYVYILLLSE